MMGGLFEFGLGGFGEVDCHYFGFRFMFMWVFPLLVCEQMCREGGGMFLLLVVKKKPRGINPAAPRHPFRCFRSRAAMVFCICGSMLSAARSSLVSAL